MYKRTGKDNDYKVSKEAQQATTNEVRKSKQNYEYKLAQHIMSDSKTFYAYVRSKQNVRDNAGCIITKGCLMAAELNKHSSSVLTRQDISSFSLIAYTVTKFNGPKPEILGREGIASKIFGREGIASKILGREGIASKILGREGIASKILGREGIASKILGRERIASKLFNVKENKLLGVDGIRPKN